MSETSERYRRLSDDYAATIASIPADGWDAPSPCEGWTARDVVRHVVDTQGIFLGFVGRDRGDVPDVDTEPARAWDHARAIVQAELDDPARATQTFQGFTGPTTFEAAVDRFLVSDLVVHGWDLARSQGQEVQLAEADMAHVEEQLGPMAEQMRKGAFGPEIDPPEGADRQTRFLAFLGRTA